MIAAIAFLGAALGALGARMAFIRQGADRRVDHHYWLVVAQALRADPRLPPIIRGRYLLEDERQSYPPFFAWFLSWFRPEFLERRAVGLSQIADLGLIGVLIVFGVVSGVTGWAMAIGAAVIGLAPVLVAYNVQVNPRSWGNLFLSVKLMAEVLAVGMAGSYEIAFWAVAIAATAGVILSHKMSTQFMLALWPAWAIVLGSWAVATIPLFGLIVATAITGPTFARLQWRSHADIVRFWHRHWRNLGAHAVRQSPIYGSPGGPDGRFHGQGLRGVVQHLKNVVAYLPLGVLAPVVLFIAPAPPAWLLAWFAGAYAMALLTLFVPFLKCFGGGHYYVFNAVLPAVLWWMLAVETGDPVVQALLAIGLIVTLRRSCWVGASEPVVVGPATLTWPRPVRRSPNVRARRSRYFRWSPPRWWRPMAETPSCGADMVTASGFSNRSFRWFRPRSGQPFAAMAPGSCFGTAPIGPGRTRCFGMKRVFHMSSPLVAGA